MGVDSRARRFSTSDWPFGLHHQIEPNRPFVLFSRAASSTPLFFWACLTLEDPRPTRHACPRSHAHLTNPRASPSKPISRKSLCVMDHIPRIKTEACHIKSERWIRHARWEVNVAR
ncbi:hypothetical protein PGTUg99_016872 [Puccinia graminis f. sp. tritici]|uniref:Uncharacterized protein n=1 Tax=Puccinia graminis f. sp. tritici TaxID=56615 RepID=A0A5B0M8Y3_PUCGR|nr:hypothetical protein PGTUg99_016872 [Puccinia graminis f. sp. tritici]